MIIEAEIGKRIHRYRLQNNFTLQELADSITAQGVMQPIVVRPISDSKYEIIAGERRWRATQVGRSGASGRSFGR